MHQNNQGYVVLPSSISDMTASSSNDHDTSSTSSEIVATEEFGTHVLTIDGYYRTTLVGRNEYIKSSPFTAAGHRWCIKYYPNGYSTPNVEDASEFISLFLLPCDDTEVFARCKFSLLSFDDQDGKPAALSSSSSSLLRGSNLSFSRMTRSKQQGVTKFVNRTALEQYSSGHLRLNRFRVRCDIGVLNLALPTKDHHAAAAVLPKLVDVPPSDILRHLGDLLSSGDGTDVVFEVGGESFGAHRSVLAARSPVFKAELFSPMKEGTATCVWVQDMEPRVFKALLHFVYNDMLPPPEVDDGDSEGETTTMVMAQHLLVAADRYCLERLKLICEEKLCGCVDTSSVGTMLALAEQHGCQGLKKACLNFLMSGGNLMAAIVTGGLENVLSSYPSVVKELLLKNCS